MKAKDYIEKYKEIKAKKGIDIALYKTFKGLILEVGEIMKARGVKKDNAMLSVIREVEQKSFSVVRLLNELPEFQEQNGSVKRSAFRELMKSDAPDVYNLIDWSKI